MARGSDRSRTMQNAEREGQADPTAELNGTVLLDAARPVLKLLREDLERRADDPGVARALVARYEDEKKRRLTGDSIAAWRDARIAQIAASWFLSCVFVRTLEDRGLLGTARIAGPGALDSQAVFFQVAPNLTERDYLLFVFRELAGLPASRELFDREHALVWQLAPSANASKELLRLFRGPSVEAPAFRFGQASTRFLGDLYQDLYDDVRKRYALLQTPDFVEHFILDRTLEPAIERFGLDDTTLIDPTCGSGHFLLGAFDRLFEHRLRDGVEPRRAAHQALDSVFGADINPYAVAIARFRLMMSFLDKAGFRRLKESPALPLHVVVADSLLHNRELLEDHATSEAAAAWRAEAFAFEDDAAARDVLHREYAAVVGNPPYITEKDPVKRERYRAMYRRSAAGKYALSAPFCERFFQLARGRGYVGQITANSFMKREFGKALIEDYLRSINIELIVNTSGAFIPGHGTPTVMLFGTNESPVARDVGTVLANGGEPSMPDDPSKGLVWSSIAAHWNDVGHNDAYVSVVRTERTKLEKHPWSLGGGGAVELKELLEERAERRLGELVEHLGIGCVTGEDEVFLVPRHVASRQRVGSTRPLIIGEDIRDWSLKAAGEVVFPYDADLARLPATRLEQELRWLWPFRSVISKRKRFGTPMLERGLTWYELQELYVEKLRTPLSITFAFVATHNHFALDRGGHVFKQSAPIIKLPTNTAEDDHLALLAYLNSSTACFLMKQVAMNKGGSGIGRGIQDEAWESRFEFDGTKLGQLAIFGSPQATDLARRLDTLAQRRSGLGAQRVFAASSHTTVDTLRRALAAEYDDERRLLREMCELQEAIDWTVYSLAGLVPSADIATKPMDSPLEPGMRAFEHCLLRENPNTQWFTRNRYADPRSLTEAPRGLSQRMRLIEEVPELALLEQPAFKRRWTLRDPVEETRAAARTYLADALEARFTAPEIASRRALVDGVLALPVAHAIAQLASDDTAGPLGVVRDVLATESVGFAAATRFTETGLAAHAEWQRAWAAQRAEDATGAGAVNILERYDSKDYADANGWRLRGKLDVPKERFISYPGCESDLDGEPIYGWAGWDHLQRARALAALFLKRKTDEGWTVDRLAPMLAGLLELLPWVLQWHNAVDPEYGQRMGDYFAQFLDSQLQELGVTKAAIEAWRPVKRAVQRPRKLPTSSGRRDVDAPTIVASTATPTALRTEPTLPTWGDNIIKEAAELAGVTTKAGAWATPLTGEALGTAALVAVLRHQPAPTSRAQVERAVTMVLLPRLMPTQLDALGRRKWKSVIGARGMAIQSIASLSVPWNAVVRAALQQHVLVSDSTGRWSAGPDIRDVSVSALDARAVVVLSWMASGAAEDTAVGQEVEALRVSA